MAMKKLLHVAAVIEAATGVALMIHPPLLSHLLLGEGVSGAGLPSEWSGVRYRPGTAAAPCWTKVQYKGFQPFARNDSALINSKK